MKAILALLQYVKTCTSHFYCCFKIFISLYQQSRKQFEKSYATNVLNTSYCEASSHDQIKMTKFWLNFDRKIFTPTDLNIGTRQKFTTLTLPQKSMLGWSACSDPPAHAHKLALAGTPAQPCLPRCFAPLLEKTSGTEVRTPDARLRFVGFIRLVSFNFGHVQLLSLIVVMVWSNSFGHLESVKGIFLVMVQS